MTSQRMNPKLLKVLINNKFGDFEIISTTGVSEQETWISDFNISVYELPVCKIKILTNNKSNDFSKLERGNKITFSFSENATDFILGFVGEIAGIEITQKKDLPDEIVLNCQTPFARLQDTYLNQDLINDCKGFRDLIRRIMTIGKMLGKVIFDEDVEDSIEIGYIHQFPAYTLLKQLCFQSELIFSIEKDNSMRIRTRASFEREMYSNVEKITEDDYSSITIKK